MLIVLEGPDGAGKTTLAKELCRKMHLEYHHEGPPPDVPNLAGYYTDLLRDGVVFDRLILSEMVYGPVLRDESKIAWTDWLAFRTALNRFRGTQVICLPPIVECIKAWKQAPEKELIKKEAVLRAVWAKYAHFTRVCGPSTVDYDWTQSDPDELLWRLGVGRS